MAWPTVNFRIFQLQGWLELLHHWARQNGGRDPWGLWAKGLVGQRQAERAGECLVWRGEGEMGTGWEKCLNSYLAPVWADAKGI